MYQIVHVWSYLPTDLGQMTSQNIHFFLPIYSVHTSAGIHNSEVIYWVNGDLLPSSKIKLTFNYVIILLTT